MSVKIYSSDHYSACIDMIKRTYGGIINQKENNKSEKKPKGTEKYGFLRGLED